MKKKKLKKKKEKKEKMTEGGGADSVGVRKLKGDRQKLGRRRKIP